MSGSNKNFGHTSEPSEEKFDEIFKTLRENFKHWDWQTNDRHTLREEDDVIQKNKMPEDIKKIGNTMCTIPGYPDLKQISKKDKIDFCQKFVTMVSKPSQTQLFKSGKNDALIQRFRTLVSAPGYKEEAWRKLQTDLKTAYDDKRSTKNSMSRSRQRK